MTGPVSLVLGTVLAASTAYLLTLLFGFVFGTGGVKRHHVEAASYLFAAAAAITAFWHGDESGSPAPAPSAWPLLTAGFVAASAVLYGNTLFLGLFSDDFVLAARALTGRWVADGAFFRPFPAALWWAVLSATSSPVALHALNVALHGLNAALVCLLSLRFNLPPAMAAAAGLLFLTFPGSVEAVVWPAAIHDLLVTACALGFLLIAERRLSFVKMVAAMVILVLGLLSKESAIAIPIVAIVLWMKLPDVRRTRGWPLLVAGTVVCLVYTAVRLTTVAVPDTYTVGPSRYLVKELIARPIGTLALPWSSAVLAAYPAIGYAWAFAFVAGAATYAWRTSRLVTPSTLVRCLVAMLVSVLPVYSMLFITADLENARYLYLSTAFWVIAAVGFAATPPGYRFRSASWVLLGVALAAGTAGVQWHLGPWREAARLRDRVLTAAQNAIDTAPCSAVSLAGAPDSVGGAFVFRNGLAEAVVLRTGFASRSAPGDCLLAWNGAAFVPARNGSVPVQATFRR